MALPDFELVNFIRCPVIYFCLFRTWASFLFIVQMNKMTTIQKDDIFETKMLCKMEISEEMDTFIFIITLCDIRVFTQKNKRKC